ncbi:MAG: hypothetical protein AAGL89_02435 [Pseudomonadota bacterium]
MTDTQMPSAVETYLDLTRRVLPQHARTKRRDWPIRNDHCFQRVVLDTITGGVWYDTIAKPAYRHMTDAQAQAAAALRRDILSGEADLHALNDQSKRWRAQRKRDARCQSEPTQKTLDL